MIGQTISHYRILEKLGEGGMGVVYKGHDTKLDRDVALKFLPHHLTATADEQARFLQEARAASALNHPNVCTIYDIAEHDGPAYAGASAGRQQFIVMEIVDGKTLRQMVPLQKIQTAIDYAIQIGEALQEAHGKGVVHRDIKTDNIMVNSKNQIKVMDFGLAKLKGSLKLTRTSSTVGTLAYMAPEQIEGGEVDARSDIFSFGVVLYEMLTGHTPFRGEHEAAMVYSIVNEEPTPVEKYLPDIPSELVHVLNRALEKDPEDRYQFVHEMVIDLRRLKKQTSKVVRSYEGSVPQRTSESLAAETKKSLRILSRKKWFRPSAISAGAVIALVLLYVLVWPSLHGLFFSTKRIQIAVISFENQTGDPQFDYLRTAIPNLLITSLEQSSALRVTTWERMRDLLKQMGKADAQVINTDLGFELCRRDSVKALVTGSFVKMGEMFATDVKVLDVESKQLLKSAGSKGEGVGSILKVQIDELGKQIATGIGLPETKVATEQKMIAEVTTSSLQAYNLYLRGVQDYENFYFVDARRSLERAVALDSTFAMACYWLASTYGSLGERPLRQGACERAYRLRERVTRKEALFIEREYVVRVERDQDKGYRLLKQIESEFPKEKGVYFLLSFYASEDTIARLKQALALDPSYGPALNQLGYAYAQRGEYQQALEAFERYAAAYPADANPYDSMGEMFYFMGRLDDAIAKFKEALDIRPDFGSAIGISYVYALKEEYDDAISWINKVPPKGQNEAPRFQVPFCRAGYEYWIGRISQCQRSLASLVEAARAAKSPGWEAFAVWMHARILADRGHLEEARRTLDDWDTLFVQAYPADYVHAFNGLTQARLLLKEGQTKPAEAAVRAAESAIPRLSSFYQPWLGYLQFQVHGELLLAQGKTDEAIRHLTGQVELPSQQISGGVVQNATFALPRDVLARAYVQKGDIDAAIKEYERITTFDPGSRDRRLIDPLHRYELAKLYERKGLKDKAIGQYEKFLSLWKNADADRVEPKDARARLARLKGPGKK
ncbi:MAG: protein kinase [Ignavibacteriales bacterium]|nr:protein kinase [Ignavibacteriales bacterium]